MSVLNGQEFDYLTMCVDYPWEIGLANLAVHLIDLVGPHLISFSYCYSLVQPFPQALEMNILTTADAFTWRKEKVAPASLFLRETDSASALDDLPLGEDSPVPCMPH